MATEKSDENTAGLLIDASKAEGTVVYTYPNNTQLQNMKTQIVKMDEGILRFDSYFAGVKEIYPGLLVCIINSPISEQLLKNCVINLVDLIKLYYPSPEKFPKFPTLEEYTPRSQSHREARQELITELYRILDPMFESMIKRLKSTTPQVTLGLTLKGIHSLRLPSDLLVDVVRSSNAIYNDISITIHETITINAPQFIPIGCAFFFREYLIYNTLSLEQTEACVKICQGAGMFDRNSTSSYFSTFHNIYLADCPRVVSIVAQSSLTMCVLLLPISDCTVGFDSLYSKKLDKCIQIFSRYELISKLTQLLRKVSIRPLELNSQKSEAGASTIREPEKETFERNRRHSFSTHPSELVYSPLAVFIHGEETSMKPINVADLNVYHFAVMQEGKIYTPYIDANKVWHEQVFARIFDGYRKLIQQKDSFEEIVCELDVPDMEMCIGYVKYDDREVLVAYEGELVDDLATKLFGLVI